MSNAELIARANDIAPTDFGIASAGYGPETKARKIFYEMRAALAAADKLNASLIKALRESVMLQSHYAGLLNMHDGGERIICSSAEEWLARLDTALAIARQCQGK